MDGWSRGAWRGAVIGACLATALACTWPLALHLTSSVPLGTETAPTVPVFDVWTLWWSADRLMLGYADLWNAHRTATVIREEKARIGSEVHALIDCTDTVAANSPCTLVAAQYADGPPPNA